jgi:hypothetical protein
MERCPFTYSNLVEVYYEEGMFCLENRRPFAAIAVLWAASDYAIEHELWGGTLVDSQTFDYLRQPIPFDSRRFKHKIVKFFELFPGMQQEWYGRIEKMYDLYRNTFLHAKLENLVEKPMGDTGMSTVTVAKPESGMPRGRRTLAEVHLIGLAEKAALEMHLHVRDFLTELNRQLKQSPRAGIVDAGV